jgi:hypothetical protein
LPERGVVSIPRWSDEERYRQLKMRITDNRTVKALGALADETEMTADELEKRHLTRERGF